MFPNSFKMLAGDSHYIGVPSFPFISDPSFVYSIKYGTNLALHYGHLDI